MIQNSYLGADIGGTKVQAGELRQEARFEISATAPHEQILAELVQGLAPLVATGVAGIGIGIGVPGLEEENGIVHNVQNISSCMRYRRRSFFWAAPSAGASATSAAAGMRAWRRFRSGK